MYVGRIVAAGRCSDGRVAALYRVSSRSFPNRTIRALPGGALVVPSEGHQDDIYKNPYIAYRCFQVVGETVVATNGAQTDPIADKVRLGLPVRDAMVQALIALDYEKDKYNTPRIAAAVSRGAESAFLGVVREDGINVRRVPLPPGKVVYLATYEIDDVDAGRTDDFDVADAEAGARFIVGGGVFARMEHPVTGACALQVGEGFRIAAHTVSPDPS